MMVFLKKSVLKKSIWSGIGTKNCASVFDTKNSSWAGGVVCNFELGLELRMDWLESGPVSHPRLDTPPPIILEIECHTTMSCLSENWGKELSNSLAHRLQTKAAMSG